MFEGQSAVMMPYYVYENGIMACEDNLYVGCYAASLYVAQNVCRLADFHANI